MTKITSKTQLHRTKMALAETLILIAKEEGYRRDLQKQDYLVSLKSHADKLVAMVDEYGLR